MLNAMNAERGQFPHVSPRQVCLAGVTAEATQLLKVSSLLFMLTSMLWFSVQLLTGILRNI
jgi:hypothetical protein